MSRHHYYKQNIFDKFRSSFGSYKDTFTKLKTRGLEDDELVKALENDSKDFSKRLVEKQKEFENKQKTIKKGQEDLKKVTSKLIELKTQVKKINTKLNTVSTELNSQINTAQNMINNEEATYKKIKSELESVLDPKEVKQITEGASEILNDTKQETIATQQVLEETQQLTEDKELPSSSGDSSSVNPPGRIRRRSYTKRRSMRRKSRSMKRKSRSYKRKSRAMKRRSYKKHSMSRRRRY
jgi:uncharacterized phage infection (PIP) family protein YhgE